MPVLGLLVEGVQLTMLAYRSISTHAVLARCRSTYLTIDELDVLRTLRITVSSTVCCSRLISSVLTQPTVLVHLDKVECAIKTTWQVRHVNVEGELSVLQVEQSVVLAGGIQKVHARADVAAGLQTKGQGIACSLDPVGSAVVTALQCTVQVVSIST